MEAKRLLKTMRAELLDRHAMNALRGKLGQTPFIVVFSLCYPDRPLLNDGYFRRVKSIDDFLSPSITRVYVDLTRRALPDEARSDSRLFIYRATNTGNRNRFVDALCRDAAAIYWHGAGRYGNPMERWALETPALKIWDVHGAVPEECRMMGGDDCAAVEDWERMLADSADCIVCVSDAMRMHLASKYQVAAEKLLGVPIFAAITDVPRQPRNGSPRFVYSGGTQVWQCIPAMLRAIEASPFQGPFHLLTPNVDEMRAVARASDLASGRIKVESVPPAGMSERYPSYWYGFLVRQDSVVNRVACPTKLVEYIEHGIVPILDFEDIGDFKAKGLRFVRLGDFIAGRLPNETERNVMALTNIAVLKSIRLEANKGLEALRAMISAAAERHADA